MRVEYLNEFLELAHTENYQEAAENLFISQATLSKHIQALETEFNLTLFDRTTRSVHLSEDGKFLLQYATKIVSAYPDDIILLVCDGAAWHKSKALRCPENIQLLSIPPYTPEMNPIEQIWKQIRSMGFRNEVFNSLDDVMNRLCETICMVTNDMIKSITGRKWIFNCFLE